MASGWDQRFDIEALERDIRDRTEGYRVTKGCLSGAILGLVCWVVILWLIW